MPKVQRFKRLFGFVLSTLVGALVALAPGAQGGLLTLADRPLFLGGVVEPNVFFELDDSGSMDWEVLTKKYWYYSFYWGSTGYELVDSGMWLAYASTGSCTGRRSYGYLYDTDDNVYGCSYAPAEGNGESLVRDWRVRSSDFNLLYYNPAVTYKPWPGMANASFTAARSNPQSGEAGYTLTRNLTGFVYEVWTDDHGFTGTPPANGNVAFGPRQANATPNGLVDLWDQHVRYIVNGSSITVETYTHDPANPSNAATCNLADAQDNPAYKDCFGTVRTVTTLSGAGTDPWGRTVAEIQQNIANWYQYARRRSFVAKGAVANVIHNLPGFRYGLSVINNHNSLFTQMPAPGTLNLVQHNDTLLNNLFQYNWQALGTPLRQGLQRAGDYYRGALTGKPSPIIESCQKNFTLLFTDGYYNGSDPTWPTGVSAEQDGDGVSNRLADIAYYYYHTDLSNLPDEVPPDPYDDATHQHVVTMAVAFGVQGDLKDQHTNSTVNVGPPVTGNGLPDGLPDTQASGSLWANPGNTPRFLANQESQGWGDSSEEPERVDDLWHAAYNSRGLYLNAQTPAELIDGLEGTLSAIADRLSSASSVALNSTSLNENTRTYQARFDSSDWSGQLLSIPISDGSGSGTCTTELEGVLCPPEWDAGQKLRNQLWDSGRTIFTYRPDTGQGVNFRWQNALGADNLSAAQQAALHDNPATGTVDNDGHGAKRLEYLRGSSEHEGSGLRFRERQGAKLGDIVHSSPLYVGKPPFHYPDTLKSGTRTAPGALYPESYGDFKVRVANRTPMLYVGANDGMVHGFNAEFDPHTNHPTADAGTEEVAYVPNALYPHLSRLTSPDYTHRYFIDGQLTRGDAFFAGAWHTVLVGTLAGGGQGIFALDVTDPTQFTEDGANAHAQAVVLWEFTDRDNPATVHGNSSALVDGDADLGYTFSRVSIVRLANGKWAAVFGNGLNSPEADGAVGSGDAVLYLVDLENGELIRKIPVHRTAAADPTGAARPNALATPTAMDQDGDHFVEAIYAGDLFGNLWKFDVSAPDPANWQVAYGGAPLFVARDALGAAQPITTRPVTGPHPTDTHGVMVYFGTGKYLEFSDNVSTGTQTQTFYGIWDQGGTTLTSFDRSDLLQQEILVEQNYTFTNGAHTYDWVIRVTSDEEDDARYRIDWASQRGWYMDLIVAGTSDNRGERVVTEALLRNDRIIFVTLLPNTAPCAFGGDSFLMELEASDGSRLPYTPFDMNLDMAFDELGDYVSVDLDGDGVLERIPVSGRKSLEGIIEKPGVLVGAGQKEFKYASGSTGGIDSTVENAGPAGLGRQSWWQLR
jgi:type IV pilus assembly protein PilY1